MMELTYFEEISKELLEYSFMYPDEFTHKFCLENGELMVFGVVQLVDNKIIDCRYDIKFKEPLAEVLNSKVTL